MNGQAFLPARLRDTPVPEDPLPDAVEWDGFSRDTAGDAHGVGSVGTVHCEPLVLLLDGHLFRGGAPEKGAYVGEGPASKSGSMGEGFAATLGRAADAQFLEDLIPLLLRIAFRSIPLEVDVLKVDEGGTRVTIRVCFVPLFQGGFVGIFRGRGASREVRHFLYESPADDRVSQVEFQGSSLLYEDFFMDRPLDQILLFRGGGRSSVGQFKSRRDGRDIVSAQEHGGWSASVGWAQEERDQPDYKRISEERAKRHEELEVHLFRSFRCRRERPCGKIARRESAV